MKTIHLICNAHIDPIWQWTWDEGIAAALSTFKSAADLADEFDYIFCHGESLLYEAVEQYAPALFERIKKLVAEGKWQITGGWYLQPDCNMPSGESFIRQIEVGQKYFKEKFGVTPTVATNYDAFGHSIGLVQILKKCGYVGYLHTRPDRGQFKYPDGKFYRWTAPDGSSIIGARCPGYCSGLGHATDKIRNEIKDAEDVDVVLWGVGNHGGGPSRKDLRDIEALDFPEGKLIHSTPEALFADNIKISGEIKRSMTPCMPGCYTSMARVKQAHRQTEALLYSVEKLMSAAALSGLEPDISVLKDAEKKILLAEFHDILPGSCVADGEAEGLRLLNSAAKTLRDLRTKAFLCLTLPDTPAAEDEYPVFVFNWQPEEVTCPVEVEFMLAGQNWDGDYRYIPHVIKDGAELPSQQIKERSTLNLDWRKRIVFEGTLAPLSVTRFSVRFTIEAVADLPPVSDKTPDEIPVSLLMYEDTGDPWAMGDLHTLGNSPKALRPMTDEEMTRFCAVKAPLDTAHVIESGEIFKVTESFFTNGTTNAVIQYKTYRNYDYSDISVTVEFADKNKLLRLRVPMPAGAAVGDGPYIVEEKTDGEFTFQKWVGRMSPDGEVTAIINDGIHAATQDDGAIYLSLLRGSGYCFHPIGDRELYPQDRYLPRIDCGRYTFNFRLCKGSVTDVTKAADSFAAEPYAVNVFPIGGGISAAEIRLRGKVSLTALRPEEDGSFTARLLNPGEKTEAFSFTLGSASGDFTAAPYEVVTFRIKGSKITKADKFLEL